MKVRIDYLNKEKENKTTIVNVFELYDDIYEVDVIGSQIVEILRQWFTDIKIYRLNKKNDETKDGRCKKEWKILFWINK